MIHSDTCSDLLDHGLVLRKFERSCEHKHVFHPSYHKPGTCQNYSFFLLEVDYDRGANAERSD